MNARLTCSILRPRRWPALLCGLSLLFASGELQAQASADSGKGAPTDAERAGARAAAIAGVEAFEAQDWQKAADYFQRAESIIHSPVHLSYLGRAQAKLGHLVLARETLIKVVRERTDSKAAEKARADAEAALKEIEPRIASLVVQVDGAAGRDFEVSIDGTPLPKALVGVPGPADPGTRTVVVTSGSARVTQQVTLGDAEKKTVTLLLPPPSADDTKPAGTPAPGSKPDEPASEAKPGSGGSGLMIGSIVAFGVGAVGLGLGVGFGLDASSKNDEASQLCVDASGSSSCSTIPVNDPIALEVQELDDAASTSRTISTVGFVVGGVGVATGVTLLVLSLREPARTGFAASPRSAKSNSAGDFSARAVVGLDYLGVAGTF